MKILTFFLMLSLFADNSEANLVKNDKKNAIMLVL